MRWCRCPSCSHKLFLYNPDNSDGLVNVNIKCSSCKKIVDIKIHEGKVKAKVYESET